MSPRRSTRTRPAGRGQSMVEYAMAVPLFLLILLGMLEFGFAFSHHLTMEYSTREGARTGAALASGTDQFRCDGVNDDNVDNQVIAAVQRVLTGSGAQLDIGSIGQIRIFKAGDTGQELGPVNVWTLGNGPTVGGVVLKFKRDAHGWDACLRNNAANPDSIGVSIDYDYHFVTPLGTLTGIGGGGQLHMSDKTVMALNPTAQ